MISDTPGAIRKTVDNVYVFWAMLAAPAACLPVLKFIFHQKLDLFTLAGQISSWLLIITLSITPLMLLLGPMPWLKTRRRYLGVATFSYAAVHVLVWLAKANIGAILKSFIRVDISTGWIALAIMLALALTSSDRAVRSLGRRWKTLQRWVYGAAILTLVHWLMTSQDYTRIAIYTVPLIALSAWRLLRYRNRLGQV